MVETTTNKLVDKTEEERSIRSAKKDLRNFDALYLAYVQSVYRYLYSRLGSQTDAEEATSQTSLSALEGFERYRHDGFFGAWLFGIARRKAADHFRAIGRLEPLSETMPSEENDLLQRVDQNERIRQLMLKIKDLSEEDQELIRLRFAAELGFAEIARIVDRKEDAVKKNLYRLLDRLQGQLEDSND
jgi:RNA polymerase sigma-70 factor (ECF subfamily)